MKLGYSPFDICVLCIKGYKELKEKGKESKENYMNYMPKGLQYNIVQEKIPSDIFG